MSTTNFTGRLVFFRLPPRAPALRRRARTCRSPQRHRRRSRTRHSSPRPSTSVAAQIFRPTALSVNGNAAFEVDSCAAVGGWRDSELPRTRSRDRCADPLSGGEFDVPVRFPAYATSTDTRSIATADDSVRIGAPSYYAFLDQRSRTSSLLRLSLCPPFFWMTSVVMFAFNALHPVRFSLR